MTCDEGHAALIEGMEQERDQSDKRGSDLVEMLNILLDDANAKLAASEERAEKLKEAVWEISTMPCRRARFVDNDSVAKFCPDLPIPRVIWCPSCIARAALAPPPEAEKKGGEK